jgi:serine/threonine protein kinase
MLDPAEEDFTSRCLDEQRERWERGDRAPVEDYLRLYPELQRNPQAILELIYQEVVLHQEIGRALTLKDCIQRFPQFEAELRDQFELHQLLESPALRESLSATQIVEPAAEAVEKGDSTRAACNPHWPAIPGYELQRELGAGGMGVVYLAHDPQLKRQVAIKVLRSESFPRKAALSRFRTEAEAIARLQHPNVAQIYEVGEHDDVPYLVLEYLEGGSLDRQLAGQPVLAPAAARLVETLARTIHHAHERGIVHRDLKPANILLQKDEGRRMKDESEQTDNLSDSSFILHPSSFLPKIADFGLAKLREGRAGVTASGAVLGTANYLPPEQAEGHGDAAGPPADIYALGAILYEMLTGRPPFQAETILATLQQVILHDPVPPGQICPGLARDLETVCLKCLQKDPTRRYASAMALAEDLRRFLAGEPIRARPVGVWEQGVKWVKRRPALAALLATSVAALVALLGLSLWTTFTLHWYNQELQEETRRADQGRTDAEANLNESLGLLDTLLTTQKELTLVPGTEHRWKKLVQQALAGYEKILRRQPTPLVQGRAGRAYARLGQILYLLGDKSAAERAYRQALKLQTALVARDTGNLDYRTDLAVTWNGLGHLFRHTAQPRQAVEAYREAIHHQEQLRGLFSKRPDQQHRLARYYHDLGYQVRDLDGHNPAKRFYQTTRELEEDLITRYPTRPAYRFLLAMSLINLGHQAAETDLDQAESHCKQVAKLLREISAKQPSPNNPGFTHTLADLEYNLAKLLIQVSCREADRRHHGKALELRQSAQKCLDRALDIHGDLAKSFPLVPKYRRQQAREFLARGTLLAHHLKRRREGLADFYQALTFFERVHDFPSPLIHQLDLGLVKSKLGNLLLSVATTPEETDRGLAFLDQATRHYQMVLQTDPSNDPARKRLARDSRTLAVLGSP